MATNDIKHNFVCLIDEDPVAAAAGEVTPPKWNESHNITGPIAKIGEDLEGKPTWDGDAWPGGDIETYHIPADGTYTEDNPYICGSNGESRLVLDWSPLDVHPTFITLPNIQDAYVQGESTSSGVALGLTKDFKYYVDTSSVDSNSACVILCSNIETEMKHSWGNESKYPNRPASLDYGYLLNEKSHFVFEFYPATDSGQPDGNSITNSMWIPVGDMATFFGKDYRDGLGGGYGLDEYGNLKRCTLSPEQFLKISSGYILTQEEYSWLYGHMPSYSRQIQSNINKTSGSGGVLDCVCLLTANPVPYSVTEITTSVFNEKDTIRILLNSTDKIVIASNESGGFIFLGDPGDNIKMDFASYAEMMAYFAANNPPSGIYTIGTIRYTLINRDNDFSCDYVELRKLGTDSWQIYTQGFLEWMRGMIAWSKVDKTGFGAWVDDLDEADYTVDISSSDIEIVVSQMSNGTSGPWTEKYLRAKNIQNMVGGYDPTDSGLGVNTIKGAIDKLAGRITYGTADPTGGSPGDIYIKYTA